MGMIDAIDGVERRLRLILEGFTPPVAPPQFAFGESELNVDDAPPRVTWVPRHGPIKGPSALGGDGTKFPRPLHSRELLFEVHVWAQAPSVEGVGQGEREDIRACEALCRHLAAAMQDVLTQGGSYSLVSEDWLTGAEMSNRDGVVCVLGVVIKTPYVREDEPMQPVTDFPITPVIVAQS